MTSGTHQRTQPHSGGPSLTVDDALFVVFRHKWLILTFVALAFAGASMVRFVRPPLYISTAKLMVHYVLDNRAVAPTGNDNQNVKMLDAGAQSIIASEIEILTSRDVGLRAADLVGPAKVLAHLGGGNDREAAASVICAGLDVEPPKSSILTVSFKHRDKDVVQPVLEAVIQVYMRKHLEVHQGLGVMDDFYSKHRDELRKKLAQTEEELRRIKAQANILFIDDTKKSYQSQIAKVQTELLDAERELAERKAMLGTEVGPHSTNSVDEAGTGRIPAEKLSDYGYALTELENLRKNERELLLNYKDAHPLIQTVRGQIAKLVQEKASLEKQYPGLAGMVVRNARSSTNRVEGVASELADINYLVKHVAVLGSTLSNIQAQASQVMELEPRIAELTRERDEQERNYRFMVNSIDQRQMGENSISGRVVNMSLVQNPSPPGIDIKKLRKMVLAVLAGLMAMGVGLAFLLELFLDRTIKRGVDIERHLHVPIFLAIPDSSWAARIRVPWLSRFRGRREASGDHGGSSAVVPWQAGHPMESFTEGLRERVITYFEVNNLNLKKPKLVAVTGCNRGAGVTTLASGLAASLSKTGDGNVLLVDMNMEQGVAHSFYKGKPGCGLVEALENENREEAQVQEKLFLATIGVEAQKKQEGQGPNKLVPARFNHLVPKLKTSDYDYIIFDMPPVSPTSPTPRMASHMDITLLVLEAEKTGQQMASRASSLMREARANIAPVLNKYRPHVPPRLSQEI